MALKIETSLARFRAALLAQEAQATGRVLAAYAESRTRLIERIDALVAQLETAGELTPGEALRLERARELLAQVEDELVRLGVVTNGSVTNGQAAMIDLAAAQAQAQAAIVAGNQAARVMTSWNRVNTGAVEALVGRLSDGSPLAEWIGQWGQETADAIRTELTRGVALGESPRTVAARLTKQTNVAGDRLLTTTRTSILDAYRDATRESVMQNADILRGVVWVSALSDLTCAACLAMHGEVFPIDYRMERHLRCRCTLAPWVSGTPNPITRTGADWFAEQPEPAQRAVLRYPSAYDAYRSGAVRLEDFAVLKRDARWGNAWTRGSVADARENATQRERRAA